VGWLLRYGRVYLVCRNMRPFSAQGGLVCPAVLLLGIFRLLCFIADSLSPVSTIVVLCFLPPAGLSIIPLLFLPLRPVCRLTILIALLDLLLPQLNALVVQCRSNISCRCSRLLRYCLQLLQLLSPPTILLAAAIASCDIAGR
jgi:hypothetical protein